MPGVWAVLTADDVPGENAFGLEHADQPVLASEFVRYEGEPVALVAADHPETARRAAQRIRVDYEVLPAVTDARRRDGPRRPAGAPAGQPGPAPEAAPRGAPSRCAPVVVSLDFEVGMQDQAFLGPESGLAVPAEDGGVDLYVATQWLHVDQRQICLALGMPPEKVRLTLSGVGGAFGGREDLSVHVHACLLALRTGKPVKMSYGREESFFGHVHRHPAVMHYEFGAETRRHAGLRQVRRAAGRRRLRLLDRRPSSATPARWGWARTGSRTSPSTPTGCSPTTRRAARCAGSGACRRPSRTRR